MNRLADSAPISTIDANISSRNARDIPVHSGPRWDKVSLCRSMTKILFVVARVRQHAALLALLYHFDDAGTDWEAPDLNQGMDSGALSM